MIRMAVIDLAAAFLDAFRSNQGHQSDGIGAWNTFVQEYDSYATQ